MTMIGTKTAKMERVILDLLNRKKFISEQGALYYEECSYDGYYEDVSPVYTIIQISLEKRGRKYFFNYRHTEEWETGCNWIDYVSDAPVTNAALIHALNERRQRKEYFGL